MAGLKEVSLRPSNLKVLYLDTWISPMAIALTTLLSRAKLREYSRSNFTNDVSGSAAVYLPIKDYWPGLESLTLRTNHSADSSFDLLRTLSSIEVLECNWLPDFDLELDPAMLLPNLKILRVGKSSNGNDILAFLPKRSSVGLPPIQTLLRTDSLPWTWDIPNPTRRRFPGRRVRAGLVHPLQGIRTPAGRPGQEWKLFTTEALN
ncbi:hypothetical protein CALCODRAFT_354472 [Calocera cornea HHB12733]|uniref:Uncharacterized protein n=1 Tax=Calocera cornea HHB12733 TaxID=1353952 RepID=A0A165ER45_9BASI|nr:hypothetical protein CALCODRAFT_354472 [Calocera cornea HHB12733]